jgi:polar amino acid transport system substrate-binding protein
MVMNYRYLLAFVFPFVFYPHIAAAAENSIKIPNFVGETGLSSNNGGSSLRALRFLTTLDFPPFSYLDSEDRLTGFNVYLAKAICAELEIQTACTIQALPFEELMQTIEAGRGDAIISGMASTSESRELLSFSNAYLRFPGRFAALKAKSKAKDFDNGLPDVKIGVLAGSGHEKLARSYFPRATVIGIANEKLLTDELTAKKIDLIFGDGLQLSFWINGEASKSCCQLVGGAYYSKGFLGEGMRIAAPISRPDVIQAINRSLDSIQQKHGIDELFLRFFPNGFF